MRSTYEIKNIAGIPCLVMGDSGSEPVCMLYHGWGSRKEVLQFFGSILAANGFAVYIPDAPQHGERGELPYHTPEGKTQFWEVILAEVAEFPQLLEHVHGREIFLAGSSMGGFAASAIFARHEAVRGCVTLMGACAWEKAEELFRRMDGRPAATAAELATLRAYDPLPQLQHTARPLLMVHGTEDAVVPIEIQRFAKQALPHVQLLELTRTGHQTTLAMAEAAVRWLAAEAGIG